MEHQSRFVAAGVGLNGRAKLGQKQVRHSSIDLQNNQNLTSIAEATTPLVPLVTLSGFTNSEGILRFSPQHSKKTFLQCGKKHKLEGENHEGDDSPPRKKKLKEDTSLSMTTNVDAWGQCVGAQVVNHLSPCSGGNLSSASMFDIPCEEMEQTVWDQQSESPRRTIQEIENSLTCDEEVETENLDGKLPRLVLSDALKEELKRDLTGALTKKIVGSFSSPPSMELVLWKPPPMLDADKRHTFSKEFKEAVEDEPNTAAMSSTFPQLTDILSKRECVTTSPSLTWNNLASAWGADEEMEL